MFQAFVELPDPSMLDGTSDVFGDLVRRQTANVIAINPGGNPQKGGFPFDFP